MGTSTEGIVDLRGWPSAVRGVAIEASSPPLARVGADCSELPGGRR
jgi:hypothetical protein